MKRYQQSPPSRPDAWKNAASWALGIATVLLLILRFFTPIVFGTALVVAIVLFVFVFALVLRVTPKPRA